VYSIFQNPAGLAHRKAITFGLGQDMRPRFPGIMNGGFSALIPSKLGNWGGGLHFFGFENYQEWQGSFAYARSFGPRFRTGISAHYYQLSIPNYGSRHLPGFAVGFQLDLGQDWMIGAYLNNPLRLKLDQQQQHRMPTILKAGLAYQPVPQLRLMLDLQKELDQPFSVQGGVDYELWPWLNLRCGFQSYPETITGGLGFQKGRFKLDVAIAYAWYTGLFNGFTLTYQFKKKSTSSPNKQEPATWDDY
jgi:hypothetical protein